MEKLEFVATEKQDLTTALRIRLPFLSNYQIEKLYKDRDVKVEGVRKNKTCILRIDDKVEVFYQANTQAWSEMVFEDENVLIVNKRAGIEVVSEDDRNLTDILRLNYAELYPVHRIDRNTEGLVIFAKNKLAEGELLKAFKDRTIIKKYLLKVKGGVQIDVVKPKMYLKKLPESSKVLVAEVKTSGYDEIVTKFNVIKYLDNETILEAELITGKTHQIRAHIAYFGYAIVGDGKYGVADEKMMCLTAYSMGFKFSTKSPLNYLNEKIFEITPTWIN